MASLANQKVSQSFFQLVQILGGKFYDGTGSLVVNLVLSGSFSGSFSGDGSRLNNLPTDTNWKSFSTYITSSVKDVYISGSTYISKSLIIGDNTFAAGKKSFAQGVGAGAGGKYSHAHGNSVLSPGMFAHAAGDGTVAHATGSHAEGKSTTVQTSGKYSHAEGVSTSARGYGSHVEGIYSVTYGTASHAEGYGTAAIGHFSHAEGNTTVAYGYASHAGGVNTIASGSGQTVFGKYNTHNDVNSLLIIGGGTSNNDRKDAFKISQSGSLKLPMTQSAPPSWIGTDGEIISVTTGSLHYLYMWMSGAWRSSSFS